jgi:superfamily II DNA helicase RecQ
MGEFDKDEEKEREKREKMFESLMQSKSGIDTSEKSLSEDIKLENKGMKRIFSVINTHSRYKLSQIAQKTNDKLKEYPRGKKLNGQQLSGIIRTMNEDLLQNSEIGYIIKVMCNKGYINCIEEKNLPLCSIEQIYSTNR